YIGVVYFFNEHYYFAPLSSPKTKHLKMSNKAIDIFKIDNGILGIININNMIPTPLECVSEVLPQINDAKYKALLIKQITFLNDHKLELLGKVKQFHLRYIKNYLPIRIQERCCDFDLLEIKCSEWETSKSNGILD
ncbi:MAG: type III toxin-antitoxin system ToxN/AbiQ family toxin, partial [Longicatena sp.]